MGAIVGTEGLVEGEDEGNVVESEGLFVGLLLGLTDGLCVGPVGETVGELVGSVATVGSFVGTVGLNEGSDVGTGDGCNVGSLPSRILPWPRGKPSARENNLSVSDFRNSFNSSSDGYLTSGFRMLSTVAMLTGKS